MHYLNVPYPDDNKLVIASSVTLFGDKKEWTKEELISQLKPMCKCFKKSFTSRNHWPFLIFFLIKCKDEKESRSAQSDMRSFVILLSPSLLLRGCSKKYWVCTMFLLRHQQTVTERPVQLCDD